MHVNVALQVGLGDERRQYMVLREIDLSEVLPHLGRDVVEIELGVNLFFSFSGDWRLAFERGQTVFV